jgi:cytochrome b561
MQTLNDRSAYGWVSVALHWLAAIGVLAMLWTGFNGAWAEDAGDRARHLSLMRLHVAVGTAFYLLWIARIASHYLQATPAEPPQPALLSLAGRAVQNLLLFMLAVQIISGPLMIWAHARPVQALGLSIPSPFAVKNEALDDIAGLMHGIGRWALVALIALHALAALKRLIVDRDGVFTRMIAPGAKLKAERA